MIKIKYIGFAFFHLLLIFTSVNIFSSESQNTQLILLGTGTPNADPERSGPALAIVVGQQSYLVDFGPGIVRQAAKASRKFDGMLEPLKPSNLRTAFLTHLHSDHTAGYPDLILTPWVLERERPLKVFGPKGLQRMTDNILQAYDADINYRIDGLEPANNEGWKVDVTEIDEGLIYQDELIKVSAFKINHGTWDNAFGYKFETADKTIVVSGDTRPSKKLIEASKNVDILVHEVYSQDGFNRRSEIWQDYHSTHHTSTVELASIANQAQPELLILNHILFWGASEDELLGEITERYNGKVSLGSDLNIY
ncbi:MBL fold metallo-hydrolase [Gammaproteobacteria bacterium]|nr:MBL fold metallo-hydrolase [Gammaproteobacteria bacterium]